MTRRDAQASGIFQSPYGCGTKQAALFRRLGARPAPEADQGAIDHLGDLLPAEDADDAIDVGHFLEQAVLFALGQAAGNDHGADASLVLERQHLADDGQGFLPGRLDEATGIDDDDVCPVRLRSQHIAMLGQLAEHALRIHQVFGTAETDEGEGFCFHISRQRRRNRPGRFKCCHRGLFSLHPSSLPGQVMVGKAYSYVRFSSSWAIRNRFPGSLPPPNHFDCLVERRRLVFFPRLHLR